MKVDMHLEGVHAALDAIDTLRQGICKGAAQGLRKGMQGTLLEAKSLCPVQTGALRDSLRVECVQDEQGAKALLLSDAPYAKSVELGLLGAAKPFMYPAYKATKAKLVSAVGSGIEREMNQ